MLASAITPPLVFFVLIILVLFFLWWYRPWIRRREDPPPDPDTKKKPSDLEAPPLETSPDLPMSAGVVLISPMTTRTSVTHATRNPSTTQQQLDSSSRAASQSSLSRFRISVPALVGRFAIARPPSAGSGASSRHGRRRSRADPVLPRTPQFHFNADDMLAPRRPPRSTRPPSMAHHGGPTLLTHVPPPQSPPPKSPRPPPPPVPPIPPVPPLPAMFAGIPRPQVRARARESLERLRKKVRPLPPLPRPRPFVTPPPPITPPRSSLVLLQSLRSPAASPPLVPRLPPVPVSVSAPVPLPVPVTMPLSLPSSPPLSSLSLLSPTSPPPRSSQLPMHPIVLQPNRLREPEREPPHGSGSGSAPQNRPSSALFAGLRRQRGRGGDLDPLLPPPYTSSHSRPS